MLQTAYFDRFAVEMTLDQALYCSHPGQCTREVYEVTEQLNLDIDPEALREELREYGAWSDEELADHEENLRRIVWLAAGNIREELTTA
jgi:hypothetical protein